MAMDPQSPEPPARGGLAAGLRRHPVMVGVMLTCALAGAEPGALYLTEDWSMRTARSASYVDRADSLFHLACVAVLDGRSG